MVDNMEVDKKNGKKYILGIEGSANKLGISIINEDMKILVNMRRTYISEIGCGFIPREISAHHRYYIVDMIKSCLKKVNIKISDITLICYTKGPGIGSALYIGYNIAKILHSYFNIPVVGVNHCIAHIEMGIFITKLYNPIVLYVSGSNTQIIYYNDHKKKYEIIGETLDIAIGNVIDRSARILKISNAPSPGYNVELLARKKYLLNIMKRNKNKNKNKNLMKKQQQMKDNDFNSNELNDEQINDNKKIEDFTELLFFPYTIKGMDISFSGYDFYITKYFSKYMNKKSKTLNKLEKQTTNQRCNEKRKDNQYDYKIKCNEKKQQQEQQKDTYSNINKKCKIENVNEQTIESNQNNNNMYNQNELGKETFKNIEPLNDNYKNDYDKVKEDIIDNHNGTVQNINDDDNNSSNSFQKNNKLFYVAGLKGNSYYEDNIIFESEHKENYGENDEYIDDNCSIETASDFYEKSVNEEEQDIIDLTDEEKRKIQICYSLQHHIFSMLIEITERAIAFTNSKEVIIVGGVGCNLFLQNMMKKMAKQKNIKIGFMDHSYCVDNGAMIAYTGYLEYLHAKNKDIYNFNNITIHQRYRTDDVFVTWK
ncbi:glycoprotease, putative [Plasmodium reichenowi]|uniref:N(6)-L-threonylcarbamoyladenine synthase n=1 Tax=Plasmodium reichenowi TaxID=5854 RepID=A0A151LFL9_PLARE|nr:glycoprotease, putative [Plasmodium reichenowi]KYN97761.1 glycoprotease, putative [Plasmodium reichenowi]